MNSLVSTNYLWCSLVDFLVNAKANTRVIAPRGKETIEIIGPSVLGPISLEDPVITVAERKLNYAFMCAEAAWILSGSNRLDRLTPFCQRMADYSDDGVTLTGAYGPCFSAQFVYVMETLLNDENTRQAVMTFWRPSPAPSKDIPCTTSLQFIVRDGKLDLYVYMRSSDAWLGVPYDIFSFSMLAYAILGELNRWRVGSVAPGNLWMMAGSRHLYKENFEAAQQVVKTGTPYPDFPGLSQPENSTLAFLGKDALIQHLMSRAVMIKQGIVKYP